MKRLLIVLLFPLIAHAENLSLDFQQTKLVDLARVVFTVIAKRPYIVTDDALKSDAVATISFQGMKPDVAVQTISALLKSSGFALEEKAGVLWISTAHPETSEFFYRPRYRPVSYLLDLLSSVFKPGSFTQQRAVQNMQQQTPMNQGGQLMSPVAQNGQLQQVQQAPIDNGTSAYSAIDKNPDAFVFKGSETDIARLKKLLVQVDTATPELFVKAVVYEVTTSKGDKSALSLALNILKGRLQLGSATPGDFSGVFHIGKLDVVVDALSTDSRFKVVSSPTLRVRSGANARLTVGTQTPVLGATVLTGNGNSSQSVEYKPSGVILSIKPDIRDDVSDLQISQQISDFQQTTTGVNTSPTLVTRELSTQVGVKDDDVLVLGGLDQNKDQSTSEGLSFLPSWLGSKSSDNDHTEVLIVLQASRI